MEIENRFASRGVGTAGLTTGIIGTAGFGLQLLNGLLNGGAGANNRSCDHPAHPATPVAVGMCNEIMPVTRYDAQKDARIAELETEVKLRDANIYTDQKSLALYQYIDGELKDIRNTLCGQAVHNQRTEDSFALARQDIAAVKADLDAKIKLEAERRCCGDNAIVRYVNATFYPKMVADVTTGTTTTAQTLYDPLPDCGCCK